MVAACLHLGHSFVQIQHPKFPLTALTATIQRIPIAVTREDGKNGKLIEEIQQREELRDQVEILELPCIEHASGPDFDMLGETLSTGVWNYVVVTSPEAAKVLASAWDTVRDNPIPVVAVGKATEKVLANYDIPVAFVPSKANAETLAQELEYKGEGTTLLYPASARARDTLQGGLEARGFNVKRLNTYDTVSATWTEDQKEQAQRAKIATFASPSSVKGWLLNTDNNKDVVAVCIGETSATACRGHSWNDSQIYFPEAPGLEAWVDSIQAAVNDIKVSHVQ